MGLRTDALRDPGRQAQPADPSGQLAVSYAAWVGREGATGGCEALRGGRRGRTNTPRTKGGIERARRRRATYSRVPQHYGIGTLQVNVRTGRGIALGWGRWGVTDVLWP